MPAVAKPKNTKAPNDPTIYDNTKVGSLQDEYYRIKLMNLKMEQATAGLSQREQEVMKQPSDLDMLTAKVLVKLKTFSDHDPLLNTFRAITGKESREEMAADLATRHYNKYITDHYIGKVLNTTKAGEIVSARDTVRGSFARGANKVLDGDDGLPGANVGAGAPSVDILGALTALLRPALATA